jgi:hypothetical protein
MKRNKDGEDHSQMLSRPTRDPNRLRDKKRNTKATVIVSLSQLPRDSFKCSATHTLLSDASTLSENLSGGNIFISNRDSVQRKRMYTYIYIDIYGLPRCSTLRMADRKIRSKLEPRESSKNGHKKRIAAVFRIHLSSLNR